MPARERLNDILKRKTKRVGTRFREEGVFLSAFIDLKFPFFQLAGVLKNMLLLKFSLNNMHTGLGTS